MNENMTSINFPHKIAYILYWSHFSFMFVNNYILNADFIRLMLFCTKVNTFKNCVQLLNCLFDKSSSVLQYCLFNDI